QPAVKDSAARTKRRRPALPWCPRDPHARLECQRIVDARLIAVADARAECQAFLDPDVVLNVGAQPRVEEIERRITGAARVEDRRAGLVRVETTECVGTEIVVVE